MALLDFFRPRRLASPEALGEFLRGQAAYVAQKTVLDYCRVKAGRSEKHLFSDADFQAALAHCRWQVFFAALADVTALVEAHLRPHAPGQEIALAERLAALHKAALQAEPPPETEAPSAAEAEAALPHYLASRQLEPALPADRLPLTAEPVLFATLPVHPEQRQGESLAIRGGLRFQVVTTQQELERRFDAAKTTWNLLNPG
ncbi:MAG: hypothetical protein K5Q68_04365 [Roseococcus sp.]|nr:hypothetical protein [Roseococcus sp.]